MKYIIHPAYEILEADDIESVINSRLFESEVIQRIKQQELFVLTDTDRDSVFTISPSIRVFLEPLKQPSSFEEVLTKFAVAAQCSEAEAFPIIQSFFNDLLNRNIIISKNKAQNFLKKLPKEIAATKNYTFLHYEIIKKLKEIPNNYTHIELAKDRHSSDFVVLKRLVLPINMPKSEKKYWQRLFKQEFDLMQIVGEHPHICRLLSFDTEGGYAVLEYVVGEGLRTFMTDKIWSINQKYVIAEQAIKAIAALHHKRILHGDIHASNFIVDDEMTLKMIDFDLANREKPLRHEWVNEGGVFEYIAPEKINKNSFEIIKERSDYRSEVYQVGIIIYIVFYGKLPFTALTWHELTDKILNENPSFDQYCCNNQSIPIEVILFMQQCLDKNPQNRLADAVAMLEKWAKINIVAN